MRASPFPVAPFLHAANPSTLRCRNGRRASLIDGKILSGASELFVMRLMPEIAICCGGLHILWGTARHLMIIFEVTLSDASITQRHLVAWYINVTLRKADATRRHIRAACTYVTQGVHRSLRATSILYLLFAFTLPLPAPKPPTSATLVSEQGGRAPSQRRRR